MNPPSSTNLVRSRRRRMANRAARAAACGAGLLIGAQAMAAGTTAGVSVVNNAELTYSVAGGVQAPVSATVSFDVDRQLSVTVINDDAGNVSVTLGQDESLGPVPASQFTVTNTSNDAVGLKIGVLETAADINFSTANMVLYRETDGTAGLTAGDTPLVTNAGHWELTAAEAPVDTAVIVYVAADVPTGLAGETGTYALVAAVAEDGAPTTYIERDQSGNLAPGTALAANDELDTAGQQDVFAEAIVGPVAYDFLSDVSAGADLAYNGQTGAAGVFEIVVPSISIGKAVEVLYDPVSGNKYSSNGQASTIVDAQPKAIPGALVMYAIGISNDDSFSVDSLTIRDNIEGDPPTSTEDDTTETLDEGDQTGAPGFINVPGDIDIDLGSGPVNFALPAVADLDLVHYIDCAAAASSTTFAPGVQVGPEAAPGAGVDDEVVVSMAGVACGPSDTAVVIYFVTLQ